MAKTKRIDRPHTEPTSGHNPGLDAIGLTALAKLSKPETQRDLLKPGFYAVELDVHGKVDGKTWDREIRGTLSVGMDSGPVASSSTPWSELLQSALCWLTAKDRQTWLATLAAGEIPPTACSVDKAETVAAEMEPALKAYRQTKAAPKKGSVAFVPAAPKA